MKAFLWIIALSLAFCSIGLLGMFARIVSDSFEDVLPPPLLLMPVLGLASGLGSIALIYHLLHS